MDRKWKSCERKIAYKSIKKAENFIRRLKKTGKIITPYKVYKCDFCDDYHIAHQRRRIK